MRTSLMSALSVVAAMCFAQQGSYDRFFGPSTMRIDFYHTGTKGQELISLDEVYEEGPWPGSRINLVDTLNLGEYLFSVTDLRTNQLVYSRGFSSIFNEWQSTDEAAAGMVRSFAATVRSPFPRRPVQIAISRRDKRMVYHQIFTTVIDPSKSGSVSRRPVDQAWKVVTLMDNGPASSKVDILILGDGYAKGDQEKFLKDARHCNDVMFSTSPFKERKNDFNVRAVEVISPESGIDIPDKELWRHSALGCRYNTFGLPRYVLTTANKTLRDIAGEAPYDFICILINDTRYGGGGIYNLYATTYTKEVVKGQDWQTDYMYVHEFGHSFGGLADEYYTSTVAYVDFYLPGVEPWEPNVTALTDRKSLKWGDLLAPGIEIPTPWDKARFDSIEALRGKLDRLAPDYYVKREPLLKASNEVLRDPRFQGKVGAFEGAGYASMGLYRPSIDCRMFSLSMVGFDPVCAQAINRVIDFYSR